MEFISKQIIGTKEMFYVGSVCAVPLERNAVRLDTFFTKKNNELFA